MKKQPGSLDPETNRTFCRLLRIIFALSFCMIGLYYELAAAVVSGALLALLLYRARKGGLTLRINDALVAVCGISLFYFLSCIWAVDSGLALWGGVKYLPLPLFGLCLMQMSRKERLSLLEDIPWIGGGMTVLSFALQFVPVFSSSLSVSGRLAGFFQYPNTFACFLLLGLALLLTGGREVKFRWAKPACGAVLLFGLLQAGSRTVFVLAVPVVLACLLIRRNRKKLLLAGVSVVCGGAVSLAVGLLGNIGGTERVLAISTGASTLLGRLLYWKDALPVILGHPLGLGYLGYYFTQGSFQTGVYTVRWVHNDFLQLLLDVGWLPAILAVIAVVRSLCSKRTDAGTRIVMLALLAHCMMDFDLEFVSMYFVLLLCLDWDDQKPRVIQIHAIPSIVISGVLCAFSLYLGVASTLTYAGWNAAAVAVYPWNTLSQTVLLSEAEDVDTLEALADQILARNDSVALAWDARALAAYANGDFGGMMTAKQQAISLARYELAEYVDYFEKLSVGYTLYLEAGDQTSAAVCLEEIQAIQTMLDEVAEETDELAWRLADTPELTMPDDYFAFLEEVEAGLPEG